MFETIERQRGRGTELLVFSEMIVPRYMIGDAFEREAFLRGFDYHESQVQPSFTRRYAALKKRLLAP